jgi:hydroxymethylglutaryl-CoA reductase (NADPH)
MDTIIIEETPVKLPVIPKQFRYSNEARLKRIEFLQKYSKCELDNIKESTLNSEDLKGINGNNIGCVEVPVGIAGPLVFNGDRVKGVHFAPLGTCDGALIESVTRGSLTISRSSGVTAHAFEQRMMRVPVFKLQTMNDALRFSKWIDENKNEIINIAQSASSHAVLKSITPRITGKLIHVEFLYTTGDAAGQNISTVCTSVACQWIRNNIADLNFNIISFQLEGNISSDKKVSYNSFINGRGIRVVAEAVLKNDVLQSVMNVSANDLFSGYLKGANGSIEAGMIGYNINVANVITAMFVATGQDIACAHESSTANLYMEKENDDLYVSLTIPSLIIGSIGGGTRLPKQNELLKMLDCYGNSKVFRLAEIIAGFSLALDISTLSAMVSDVFASAHERLARKPTKVSILKGTTN